VINPEDKMNHEFDKWLEIGRRRPLSPAEQSQLNLFLARHPHHREEWFQETALTRLLQDLPPAPLSSNFTQRVLAHTTSTPDNPSPRPFQWRFPWPLFPRPALGFALASLAVLLGGTSLLIHQQRTQSRLAETVADISRQLEFAASATELPAVDLLKDFDAIYHLSQSQSMADEELLAALQ
jgi:hypothetical protein